jgi:hypothetical protein
MAHTDDDESGNNDASSARRGLGSIFSTSAFRPPILPPSPPPPPSPKLSYSTFDGTLEEWEIKTIRAVVDDAGLPTLVQWEDATLSFSTYLRDHKWAANHPFKAPDGTEVKDGTGLLGLGGSKVATFVRFVVLHGLNAEYSICFYYRALMMASSMQYRSSAVGGMQMGSRNQHPTPI